MKNKKTVSAQRKTDSPDKNKKLVNEFSKNKNLKYLCYAIVLILPFITAYNYYQNALTVNGFLSFPLDDPWIHLTFARNIAEYFSFSYFKNEMVTAGSTSPLYTIFIALEFLFTKNEMLLSYASGVLFFAAASFYFYKLSLSEFNDEFLFSLSCALLFILDYWMNFISLSGMETTLFIFLLLLGTYLYRLKKIIPLAIVMGLVIWTRPDGTAFAAAVIVSLVYERFIVKDKCNTFSFSRKELLYALGIFTVMLGGYFIFNLYLSGTILPNTYRAKIAFNADSDKRISFITRSVWNYFISYSYKYFIPGFFIAVGKFIYDSIKRVSNKNTVIIFFVFIFLFIYMIKLPSFTRFGRYMMPLIPFFILLSVSGYRDMIEILSEYLKRSVIKHVLNFAVIVTLLIVAYISYDYIKNYYAQECKFIYDRQVKTSKWLAQNTVESDLIATHDIGAVGYYSGRKLVDVAGLINPELGARVGDEDYNETITEYMKENGVTHTAFLREWYVMENQNPVFISPESSTDNLEIFVVNKFNPEKSKVLSRRVNKLMMTAAKFVNESKGPQIISSMDEVIAIDPEYSLAYFYRAFGYSLAGDMENFEKEIKKSIEVFPEFKEALIEYGKFLLNYERYDEARSKFETVITFDPKNKKALQHLKSLNDTLQKK